MKPTKWPTYALLVCGHYPKCERHEITGMGTCGGTCGMLDELNDVKVDKIEISSFCDEVENDYSSPPPIGQGSGVVDPFLENPCAELNFQLSKWSMCLPEEGESAPPEYISEKEVRQIAHNIFVEENSLVEKSSVRPIFVTTPEGGGGPGPPGGKITGKIACGF